MIEISGDTVRDIERIKKKLATLAPEASNAGTIASLNYLLNILGNKEVPPYKHVSRVEAFGKAFFTDKQRRWFFAALKSGKLKLPYARRGKAGGVQSQWFFQGEAPKVSIENRSPYAGYLYGDNQSRMMGKIGWKKISAIVQEYSKNTADAFMRGVRAYMRGKWKG